mmetsp:Transcript_44420/g.71146  ORF Transcript_44420/g.71146 Transcript_44420/m.71146 type:complete len:202 (+) Transcript_44420:18-623(+)
MASLNQEYVQSTDTASRVLQWRTVLCEAVCFLPFAIAAIVIAAQYDATTSECANEQLIIDLATFLYVAGFVLVAEFVLHVLVRCASIKASPLRLAAVSSLTTCGDCCFVTFHVIWAGIGLYMYIDEMTAGCQQEAIGQMLLAWSISIYVLLSCCRVVVLWGCGAVVDRVYAVRLSQEKEATMTVDDTDESGDDAHETDPLI